MRTTQFLGLIGLLEILATASEFEITIHVDDYSGIEPAAMSQAEDVARSIFQRAGIGVQWTSCPKLKVGQTGGSNCRPEPAATHLFVRVLSERMCREMGFASGQFGMAVVARKGRFANDAYVCSERIANRVRESTSSLGPPLGALIAHEAGHLLLGGNSHSPDGIMRAWWTSGDIQQILEGRLSFTPEQSEKMRGDVRKRWNVKGGVLE